MFVCDQPEERTILCLKRRDSCMDCTHCVLPTKLQGCSQTLQYSSDAASSDEDAPRTARRQSIRNSAGERSTRSFPKRSPSKTVGCQLSLGVHATCRHLDAREVKAARDHLINHSAHEYPPALAGFAGLGSSPFHLYTAVSFDKLHVLDLGLTRLYCDHTNSVIRRISDLPVSRAISIANNRYSALPPSARLSAHQPFRYADKDSQAGISAKIRRYSVPFLWICVIGLSSLPPDDDPLVQCALKLNVVNEFLCTPSMYTKKNWMRGKIIYSRSA